MLFLRLNDEVKRIGGVNVEDTLLYHPFFIPRRIVFERKFYGSVWTTKAVAPEGLPMAIVLFAILIRVMIKNREKYLPMVRG